MVDLRSRRQWIPQLRAVDLPQGVTIALIVAIAMGIFFRVFRLGHDLFWVDEVYTTFNSAGYTTQDIAALFQPPRLLTAQGLLTALQVTGDRGLTDVFRSLITEDTTHVPLYYAVTHYWVQGFGSSVVALRSPAALFSLVSVGGMALLARSLFQSWGMALLAAALMAVSPFHVLYAHEARPYSLWLLMTVVSSGLLVRSRSRPHSLTWVGYGLSVSLGLYTFLYMPLVVAAQALYVLLAERGRWTPVVRRCAVALVGSGASFVPWLVAIAPYRDNLTGNTRWQVQPASAGPLSLIHNLGLTLARGFVDIDPAVAFWRDRDWLSGLLILAVVAGVVASFGLLIRRTRFDQWGLPLLLVVVPAGAIVALELVIGQQQSGIPRYFTPCYVGIELAVAAALYSLLQSARRRMGMILLGVLIAVGILSGIQGAIAATGWHKSGDYILAATAEINAANQPFVLLDSDAWSIAFAHHLAPETPLLLFNSGLVFPAPPAGYGRYFVVHPTPEWIDSYAEVSGYTLRSLEGLETAPVWEIEP